MIRRIELVNFMSHARTVIEPASGLTVLVGPNNCGKSAIVTALQILCHNDNSTYVTRHSERECAVTVETDDGHVIEWCRRNNSPRYTINGEPFDRLGRGAVPDGLHDLLRLPKVTAEGNQEFDVHFGEQKSPVFLLDKPGSHAAQFFASSSDAASLVEMQKRHQQKMVDARRERVMLEAEAERLTADLAALSPTDALGSGVEQLEADHAEIGRLATSISEINEAKQALEQATQIAGRHDADAATLSSLQTPPALIAIEPVDRLLGQLIEGRHELDFQSAHANTLLALQSAPVLADDQALTSLISNIRSAERASLGRIDECVTMHVLLPPPNMTDVSAINTVIRRMDALHEEAATSAAKVAALASLPSPPVLADERALAQDLRAIIGEIRAAQNSEAVCSGLESLLPVPDFADATPIQLAITGLTGAQAALSSADRSFAAANAALHEAEQTLRAWVEKERQCPTCGSPLDATTLIAKAASGIGSHSHA